MKRLLGVTLIALTLAAFTACTSAKTADKEESSGSPGTQTAIPKSPSPRGRRFAWCCNRE